VLSQAKPRTRTVSFCARRSIELPTTPCPASPPLKKRLACALTARLKEAPSSFRGAGDVMLSASHVAATALLHPFRFFTLHRCKLHKIFKSVIRCSFGSIYSLLTPAFPSSMVVSGISSIGFEIAHSLQEPQWWRNLFQSGETQVHVKKLSKIFVFCIGNCEVPSIET